MRNFMICRAYSDPWNEVVKTLKKNDFNLTYWIGWEGYFDKSIFETFPDLIYHENKDATLGIVPKECQKYKTIPVLDGAILNKYAEHELMALNMMERMDVGQHSFTFRERQQHFRSLLNYWMNILKSQSIQFVISPLIPHAIFDYAIYLGCEILNIPYLAFKLTSWPGRLMPLTKINTVPDYTQNVYDTISPAIIDLERKVSGDYQAAEPGYMIQHNNLLKKNFLSKLIYVISQSKKNFSSIFKFSDKSWKRKSRNCSESKFRNFEALFHHILGTRFLDQLKTYYENRCVTPDLKADYIYFALHYQPELTTCPEGGIFVDQVLAINTLASYLPQDVYIYVKEHKAQFSHIFEGYLGRNIEFYDDLLKNPKVRFISTEFSSFDLIDSARATATLTGTVGMESLLRNIPVIVFGNAWYEHLEGVIKIGVNESQENVFEKVTKTKIDRNRLLHGLNSTYNNSVEADIRGAGESIEITSKESAINLSNYILETFLVTDRPIVD